MALRCAPGSRERKKKKRKKAEIRKLKNLDIPSMTDRSLSSGITSNTLTGAVKP